MIKIGVVYPFFAHYRGPILEKFKEEEDIDFYFLGGLKTNKAFYSLKLHNFKSSKRFIPLKNVWFLDYFLWQTNLLKEIKRNNFDAVIFLGDWKYLSTWRALQYLNKKKVPAFFWSHGILDDSLSLNNRLKFHFYTKFKGGFLYSEMAKAKLQDLGFMGPLEVVFNSLDYDKQQKVIKEVQEGKVSVERKIEGNYLIFTGRLIAERRLEILIDAIELLNSNKDSVKLLIIGNGPYEKTLKDYAIKKGVQESVIFFGSCYDERVIGHYFMNATACVFPGPIGLTLIHALTYGTPVITNDNMETQKPEIEALVPTKNGLLFEEGNLKDLVSKINYITNLSDTDRGTMRYNALEMVANKYNPTTQLELFKRFLFATLKNR